MRSVFYVLFGLAVVLAVSCMDRPAWLLGPSEMQFNTSGETTNAKLYWSPWTQKNPALIRYEWTVTDAYGLFVAGGATNDTLVHLFAPLGSTADVYVVTRSGKSSKEDRRLIESTLDIDQPPPATEQADSLRIFNLAGERPDTVRLSYLEEVVQLCAVLFYPSGRTVNSCDYADPDAALLRYDIRMQFARHAATEAAVKRFQLGS
jgi:hypothetical protein